MLKAILFDMDGVIVDTEPLHHKAYFGMFDELNIQVTEKQYQAFTGQSTINVCKELCNYFNLIIKPEELVQIKRSIFKDLFVHDSSLQLLEGVLELIKDYDMKLHYHPGKANVVADALSRKSYVNTLISAGLPKELAEDLR